MQLAFFPWIRLDEPMTLGEVRLIPYRRKDKTLPLAHVSKSGVDAIFKAYADRPGKAVQHGVIVEVGQYWIGADSLITTRRKFAAGFTVLDVQG